VRQFGLHYIAAFPLPVAGAVWGSFQVYAPHANFFDETEINLMTQVCEEISLALTAIHHGAKRKKAEAHLRLQSSALEAAANAIVITDSKGVIEWVNTAFTALAGYTLAEVVGNTHRLLKSGKHDPLFYKDLWKTVSAGNVWHGEIVNRRKDGILYTEEMTITPIRDDQGRINHFIAVKQDITARKLLESQLLRSQRMESIGTLAGGIAHDLNNGLSPILMAVEALKRQVPDPGGQRLLALVATSVDHCSALIRQVLTFARGVEGQTVVIDPLHIVREIENIVRDTFPKNIDFISDWSRGIWTVTGDPTQLRQVLVNLCVNARDAMPRGGTLKLTTQNVVLDEVYANMNPDSSPGAYVLVKVEDTGAGIPSDIRDRIFEPFFTTKDIGQGTGLGLSTSLGIIKSHRGFINLYSETGKGTIFSIYLPANAPSAEPGAAAAQASRLPRGNGELILLVDDEECLRTMAQSTLEQYGYRVITASNGAEAVAIYAQQGDRIAIVLTDIAMPIIDGPTAIVAIKTLNPTVKIIASSGLPPAAGNAAALGVSHFVPKPYTAATMLNALAEALREVG
jgi:PAS domain S-box-containing protein